MSGLSKAQVTRVYLPSTENSSEENRLWADMRSRLYLSDKTSIGIETDPGKKLVATVSGFIDKWNMTNSAGDAIPPTFEWVEAMDENDFIYLLDYVNKLFKNEPTGLNDQENLTSSATSQVAETQNQSPTIT